MGTKIDSWELSRIQSQAWQIAREEWSHRLVAVSGELVSRYYEACEHVDRTVESYTEVRAQYDSERHAFGDAWPGAAKEVADLRRGVDEAEAEADRLYAEIVAIVGESREAIIERHERELGVPELRAQLLADEPF